MAGTVKRQSGKTALFLGTGYCARALVPYLRRAGYDIYGTSRTPENANSLNIKMLAFDGSISDELRRVLSHTQILLSSIPARDDGDPFLGAIDHKLLEYAPHLKWAGYLSATSVYGDRGGCWAFEDEYLYPALQRGRNRIEAELAWMETGAPVHVFRLAGIYGPEIGGMSRNPFARLRAGTARAVIKPGHVVNRIHVADIASAVMASIAAPRPMRVYNLADDHPAPPQDVLNYAADLLGVARPKQTGHGDASLSDMARSFYSETKRISNERAKKELGWRPQFPHYKQGLMAAYKAEQENPDLVILSGYLEVADDDIYIIKSGLAGHIKRTRAERGCERFDVWQDVDVPNIFHVFEIFKSPAAFEHHQKQSAKSEWAVISQSAKRQYHIVGTDSPA